MGPIYKILLHINDMQEYFFLFIDENLSMATSTSSNELLLHENFLNLSVFHPGIHSESLGRTGAPSE